jgi:nuclear transcription factor Y alpha
VQPYLHESRHAHAVARMRGPGGRFLTKEEKAAELKKREAAEQAEKATANSTQADGNSGSQEVGAL